MICMIYMIIVILINSPNVKTWGYSHAELESRCEKNKQNGQNLMWVLGYGFRVKHGMTFFQQFNTKHTTHKT